MKKKLLFLGCNHSQIPYLEILKNQNWYIVGVDLNPDSPGRVMCDSFHNVGYDNFSELINVGVKEGFTSDDKVFTASAQFAHVGAATFAQHFNIIYPTEESIKLCLDKAAYYEFFQQNDIPIPSTWYISSKAELRDLVLSMDSLKWYYLKSDFSKNPSYVYRFNASSVPYEKIFWVRDRYLREFYILQEEFLCASLRLNLYGDRFNVFDFNSGNKTAEHHDRLIALGVIKTLQSFVRKQGLGHWLIKFDVILSHNEYAVLDIGMDPPSRMLRICNEQNFSLPKFYIDQYLFDQITYPDILD